VLDIENVTKRFHTLVAIDDLSLRIPEGEVLGVLGPNGAGKTTLFKLIAGFLHPDAGSIRASSPNWPTTGYKPERLLFPNRLRVRQYLEMVADLSNIPGGAAKKEVTSILEQVDLAYAAEKRIKDCSKGMRQRLGLAQAMIGKPQLLLLDEPSNGLDPEGQSDICRLIEKLHTSGLTIVLASHQLNEVTEVCTQLVILNQGSIHYENRMVDALAERPHTRLFVDRDVSKLRPLLLALNQNIEIERNEIVLSYDAMSMRPNVLRIVLAAGYDVTRIEQSRVSLAEIYAEAVQ